MSSYVMVEPDVARALGLSGTLVEEAELEAARAAAAKTHSDAEGAPLEPQEGAHAAAGLEVVAEAPRKPRRARQSAGECDRDEA